MSELTAADLEKEMSEPQCEVFRGILKRLDDDRIDYDLRCIAAAATAGKTFIVDRHVRTVWVAENLTKALEFAFREPRPAFGRRYVWPLSYDRTCTIVPPVD